MPVPVVAIGTAISVGSKAWKTVKSIFGGSDTIASNFKMEPNEDSSGIDFWEYETNVVKSWYKFASYSWMELWNMKTATKAGATVTTYGLPNNGTARLAHYTDGLYLQQNFNGWTTVGVIKWTELAQIISAINFDAENPNILDDPNNMNNGVNDLIPNPAGYAQAANVQNAASQLSMPAMFAIGAGVLGLILWKG